MVKLSTPSFFSAMKLSFVFGFILLETIPLVAAAEVGADNARVRVRDPGAGGASRRAQQNCPKKPKKRHDKQKWCEINLRESGVKGTPMCIAVKGSGENRSPFDEGESLHLWECSGLRKGHANQFWKKRHGNLYENQSSPKMCLDTLDGEFELNSCEKNKDSQMIKFKNEMLSIKGGKCLALIDKDWNDGKLENGSELILENCNSSSKRHKWRFQCQQPCHPTKKTKKQKAPKRNPTGTSSTEPNSFPTLYPYYFPP